ncbi:MAG: hypothetical protein HC846_05670 [Blastocatellia bacterium]|nr:hypothetical protein [Blastocatellia bacterium]
MIRMGRSNKTEPIPETPQIQDSFVSNSSGYGYRQDTIPTSNRANVGERINGTRY